MAAKMTQAQTVAALAESQSVSKKEAKAFLESLAALAVSQTKTAGEFTVPGIGKLVKSARKARLGRNPATGETIRIAARTVVKFRVAKAAKDSIAP